MIQQATIAFLWVGVPLAVVVWTITRPVMRHREEEVEDMLEISNGGDAEAVPVMAEARAARPMLVAIPPNEPMSVER